MFKGGTLLSKVMLDLPPVEDMPGRRVQVLWGVKGTELQMELSQGNLEYVRVAIMNSPSVEVKPKAERRPKCSPKKKRKRRKVDLEESAEPVVGEQPPAPAEEEDLFHEGSDQADS